MKKILLVGGGTGGHIIPLKNLAEELIKNNCLVEIIVSSSELDKKIAKENLEKFKGQVSQIISPYKENRPFEVYIKINGVAIDLDKSNEELRDLAISRFEFEFDGTYIDLKGKTKLTKQGFRVFTDRYVVASKH